MLPVPRQQLYGTHPVFSQFTGVKYQLGYPEAARDMLATKSILTAVEQYTMGKVRSLDEYKRIVGLNMTTKGELCRNVARRRSSVLLTSHVFSAQKSRTRDGARKATLLPDLRITITYTQMVANE